MHDYDNIPMLNWTDVDAPLKAKAQILHQEPIILQMPDSFDTTLDPDDFGCQTGGDGVIYNCDGGKVLDRLSALNDLPALRIVAEACFTSSSQVDLDTADKRIIVHD